MADCKRRSCRIKRIGLVTISLGFLAVTGCGEGEPDLSAMPALLADKRFDEAEALLQQQARVHPEDVDNRILLAQVALAKPKADPGLAVKVLEGVKAPKKRTQAVILLNQGKAYSNLHDYANAEASWRNALETDPQVPEAGWALLGLYYVQGRRDEAQTLGMSLFQTEPDPRDRVQLLLELFRQDAMPLEPVSVAETLETALKLHPGDLQTTIAVARNFIKGSAFDRGTAMLRQAVKDHPNDPIAWLGLSSGLDAAGNYKELGKVLENLPMFVRRDPRFARYRGRNAQENHDWTKASEFYLDAWNQGNRDLELTYRLSRALLLANRRDKAERFATLSKNLETAKAAALSLYEEANVKIGRDFRPSSDHLYVYERLAENCEKRGLNEQGTAWRSLIAKEQAETGTTSSQGKVRSVPTPVP